MPQCFEAITAPLMIAYIGYEMAVAEGLGSFSCVRWVSVRDNVNSQVRHLFKLLKAGPVYSGAVKAARSWGPLRDLLHSGTDFNSTLRWEEMDNEKKM